MENLKFGEFGELLQVFGLIFAFSSCAYAFVIWDFNYVILRMILLSLVILFTGVYLVEKYKYGGY